MGITSGSLHLAGNVLVSIEQLIISVKGSSMIDKQFFSMRALTLSGPDKIRFWPWYVLNREKEGSGNQRIPFTLTYHPQNLAVKNVILKNFKILRNDPESKHIFPLPPLISFKRDKNVGNFLVRSALKSNNQPGNFQMYTHTM